MAMLTLLGGLVGVALIGTALFDALETIVVPRRVSPRLRLSRVFYWVTWTPYAGVARGIRDGARRETFLSFFGPLSLLLMVALWALILVVGFALIEWAVGMAVSPPDQQRDFGTDLYFSGTTFVTLGLGDVVPDSGIARALTVVEPYLAALADYLVMELPGWERAPGAIRNWESTAWDFTSPVALLGPTSPFNKSRA